MRKNSLFKGNTHGFPACFLFLAGLFAGMLLPNLAWKFQWSHSSLAAMYLLKNLEYKKIVNRSYFTELLRMRGSYFALSILCGLTVFGAPLAVLRMLLLGAELGALMGTSVLEFGLTGGAVGAGLLFPQYLIYVPVMCGAMGTVWAESVRMWRNHGIIGQKLRKYFLRTLAYSSLYFTGIILEYKVNPWIVEKIMDSVKFF